MSSVREAGLCSDRSRPCHRPGPGPSCPTQTSPPRLHIPTGPRVCHCLPKSLLSAGTQQPLLKGWDNYETSPSVCTKRCSRGRSGRVAPPHTAHKPESLHRAASIFHIRSPEWTNLCLSAPSSPHHRRSGSQHWP